MELRNLVLAMLVLATVPGLSFALTNVTSCAELGTPGETYTLQNDVSGSLRNGACLHITADRVTLLCEGHSIESDDPSADITGILVEGDRATVRGCRVAGYTYDSGAGYGLLADGYDNLTLEDSSFGKNEHGLLADSDGAIIRRCNSSGNIYWGFLIHDSGSVHVSDSIARGNDRGFQCSRCDYAVFERNLAENNDVDSGFEFQESSFMRISGNNATGNNGDGFFLVSQVPESHNNFTGNRAEDNGINGFRLWNEDQNLLTGNYAANNSMNGFLVENDEFDPRHDSNGNVFINNTAEGNGYRFRCLPGTYPCPVNGFMLDLANDTLLSGNMADNNAGYGFVVYRGAHNVLDSNTASWNMQGGYLVSAHEDIRRSYNNLTGNVAYSNFVFGFYIRDDNNYLARNNASWNGAAGFYLDQPYCFSWACSGDANTLEGNIAEWNGYNAEAYCPGAFACYDGFTLANVSGTTLRGNTANDNSGAGFGVYMGSHGLIDSNDANRNSNGFVIDDSGALAADSYHNLTGNSAMENSGSGFAVYDDHNLLRGNTAGNNMGNGFQIGLPSGCGNCSGEHNELIGNTAYGNGGEDGGTSGFFVNAANTLLEDNLAYGNSVNGFWVDSTIFSHVSGVELSDNVAYGHHHCGRVCEGAGFKFSGTTVLVSSAFGAAMSRNIAYDNDYGVLMYNGDLEMAGDRLYGNGIDLDASNPSDRVISALNASRVIFDRDEGDVEDYTTLSLYDRLHYDSKSMSGEHYMLDHAVRPAGDLPYGVPFYDKFINITDACPPGGECLQADIERAIWHWSGPEEADYSGIQLWELGERGWSIRNDTPLLRSLSLEGVDTFSVFALFANYTPVDEDEGGTEDGSGTESDGQNEAQPSCADDEGCAVNERCVGGECAQFPCACGSYVDHACVPYACCSDSDCGAGGRCVGNSCQVPAPEHECVSDLQCPAQEFCDIPAGAAGGSCEPVPGGPCGEVRNHSFVPYGYECGPEPGCPSCPEGSSCLGHECVAFGVSCPTNALVGTEATCTATREDGPCAGCTFKYVAPDGSGGTGATDEAGGFSFRMDRNGTYRVTLFENGEDVRTIQVRALPGAEPEKPEGGGPAQGYELLLWALIVLAALAIALVFWRRRRGAGKPKK